MIYKIPSKEAMNKTQMICMADRISDHIVKSLMSPKPNWLGRKKLITKKKQSVIVDRMIFKYSKWYANKITENKLSNNGSTI